MDERQGCSISKRLDVGAADQAREGRATARHFASDSRTYRFGKVPYHPNAVPFRLRELGREQRQRGEHRH
jgi:hypothetical protein